MKIGILHLSDFHIREGERFLNEKIEKLLDSLNILGKVDEYVIVFSGDLAHSAKICEYKSSKYIIGKIINGIKQKHNKKYINLLMTPGNHDLYLTEFSRSGETIQKAYDNGTIESLVDNEIDLLKNYYQYSHASAFIPHEKILDRRFCSYNDCYKIQFNLINTSLFSTLKPDDKEIHYFPTNKISSLKKQNNANICITVMHHSFEWFNWKYRSDLEKTIIDNSELLLIGHDHCEKAKKISIDNSMDTWISCAGEMKFSDIKYEDSFNIILIDVNTNTFNGYILKWNPNNNIYVHQMVIENKLLQTRTSQLLPLPSYLKEIKEDSYNNSDDFTKYFVFPKLISEEKNELGKINKILNIDDFLNLIETKKRIVITGSSSSGKSTLLKHLYCSISTYKTPLFLSIESSTKIKPDKFIKRLFEDQYGEDSVLFKKYEQLDTDKKIIIIDGWDNLPDDKGKNSLLPILEANFNYIVLSINDTQQQIFDSIKDEIDTDNAFCRLKIKPFFTEKRNQLVRNICNLKTSFNDEEIDKVNKLIDSLVHNNSGLFTLDPAFIIKYTDYFIKDHSYDYAKGEAIFSKIFEYGIQNSIMKFAKNQLLDEIITAFEELAGYIYSSRKDILKVEELCKVIEKYNDDYSVKLDSLYFLEIGIKSKILKSNSDSSVYFSNKNYLAYFIAKYLLRLSQSVDMDYKGIEYALKNICFGINSDIILFISYLSNNTRIVMAISNQAGELLSPWEELNFDKGNINFIKHSKEKEIEAPTKDEHTKVKVAKEHMEENNYIEQTIEAKGVFDYNEADIDKYPFRLIRARKYTEMLCKSLPAFNNMLKRQQKEIFIDSIYSYPHKIAFALLEPIDNNFEKMCTDLLEFANKKSKENNSKKVYIKENIIDMINSHATAVVLSIYDHFSELCTNSKTIDLLSEKESLSINQSLQKLIIKENSGNTDIFYKEAEKMFKEIKDEQIKQMIKQIVRKHLLCNPDLPHSKRHQIIDKFLGNKARKNLLLPSNL